MGNIPRRARRTRAVLGALTAATLAVTGTVAALVATSAPASAEDVVVLNSDFEGTSPAPWSGRGATVSLDTDAHSGAQALKVSGRTAGWNGPQVDVSSLFTGGQYHVTGWVKLAAGQAPTQLNFGVNQPGASNEYPWVGSRLDVTDSAWVQLDGYYTVLPATPPSVLYIESASATAEFLLDDVVVTAPPSSADLSLTPLKDTIDIPGLGVAIDARETTGGASELLLHHFNQITPENHMKVEAWYDADKNFRINPEAVTLLDYAAANDLRLYGHVLVWHSQTPDWFFQHDDGTAITSSEADKQLMRDRLRTHIDNVAAAIAEHSGLFGSDTNPMVGIDVVNEVVSDANDPGDGLRRSAWYSILGEEYISLAFQYADEAFNHTYAAADADRPVALFINDYNTEQGAKQDRYFALVQRLLAAGVPVDGVGHQFHSSLTTPISSLDAALDRFEPLGLEQAVTELDVTIGTPVTAGNLIKQAYWYRDAFNVFREHASDLFSVTLWGLTDDRSWRSAQAPLLFDAGLQAKDAYTGAAGGELPPLLTAANVFGGDVALDASAADAVEWRNLPAQQLTESAGTFVPRWNADHLTLLVTVAADSSDTVTVSYGGQSYAITKAGAFSGGAEGIVLDDAGEGWRAVLHLPHSDVVAGGSAQLDVAVAAGGTTVGAWNTPGATGTLTFLEDLSTVDVVEVAGDTPVIDGVVDDVWADANVITTGKTVEGAADGATADVRTLWKGDDTLYVLAEVTDPVIDVSSGDPWVQDSVELFLDVGNAKAGGYGPNDSQMRISVDNVRSFGTGDVAAQDARLTSATARTATGYVVELAISLRGQSGGQDDVALGGLDTFQGLDVQVNDGRDGSRYSVHTWAEPTGTGYQTTSRWGVAHLVGAPAPEAPVPPLTAAELTNALRGGVAVPGQVQAGGTAKVKVDGAAGTAVQVWFYGTEPTLTEATASAKGEVTIQVPAGTASGKYKVAAYDAEGTLLGWNEARVR